jgi:hypothetical protein
MGSMNLIRDPRRQRGQMVVLFALSLAVIVLAVGLVIDGGNALVQRRASQNAADFAALAGARIVAEHVGGDLTYGTDVNVQAAIRTALLVNGGAPITFGAPDGPRYVDDNGALLGYVGTGALPVTAAGVKVGTDRSWRPYFLGIIGVNSWTASATATATGGFSYAPPTPGSLFPAAIALSYFQTYPYCSGPVSTDPTDLDNKITVTVPIWDTAGGTGSNGWYHIVGFAGFQITGCSGGKDIEGVWRKAFFNGPTTITPGDPLVPQSLGTHLIR